MTCETANQLSLQKANDYTEMAIKLCQENDFTEAYKYFCLAVKTNTASVEAWIKLGTMFKESRLPTPALVCFRHAFENAGGNKNISETAFILAEYADCLCQLYDYYSAERTLCVIRDDLGKKITPQQKELIGYYQANIHLERGEYSDALYEYKRLKDKTSYKNLWLGAMAYFGLGNIKKGLILYDQAIGIRIADITSNFPFVSTLWNGEAIWNECLYVFSEQGFGDAIQFVRFIRQAATKCKFLYLHVHEELISLFRENFRGSNIVVYETGRPIKFSQHVPLSCLPKVLKKYNPTTWWNGPYIDSTKQVQQLTAPVGTKLKVGIAWAGRNTHQHDTARSCDFDTFLRNLCIPGIELYSLQKGHDVKYASHDSETGLITDLSPLIHNFNDTASFIKQLDCVISVDSSVAHLCGAMGVPCHLILPKFGVDWRWFNNDGTTPWYANHHLYQQQGNDDWSNVLGRVARNLTKQMNIASKI